MAFAAVLGSIPRSWPIARSLSPSLCSALAFAAIR
jgi:hypothetical protein